MTTNIYLGFPFGVISVSLHGILMFADPRRSYRFYNISLFFWVSANFIWMTLEVVCNKPSSNVHVGPAVPLGGIDSSQQATLINIKTVFFTIAAIVQVMMYIGIFLRLVDMPEDENEDVVSKNEAQLLLRGGVHHRTLRTDLLILKGDRSVDDHSHAITLAFIENAYIIFWTSKDLFWSFGTGDLTRGRDQIIFYESTAMLFGTLSILIYFVTAYIYRRNVVLLMDAVTTICWIGANFVWMCGEFFIRYDDLKYDDSTEQNDSSTRIVSSILFCSGLLLQFSVIAYLTIKKHKLFRRNRRKEKQVVEMFTFGPMLTQGNIVEIATSPTMTTKSAEEGRGRHVTLADHSLHAVDVDDEVEITF